MHEATDGDRIDSWGDGAELVEIVKTKTRGLNRRRGGKRSAVDFDDAVSAAVLRLLRFPPKPGVSIAAAATVAAKAAAADEYRAAPWRRGVTSADGLDDDIERPDRHDDADEREEVARILALFARLAPRDREVIRAAAAGTLDDIARRDNVSAKAVWYRLHVARETVAGMLGDRGRDWLRAPRTSYADDGRGRFPSEKPARGLRSFGDRRGPR
jgi:RNA polymerase sigma factor (sigma-70 family)